MAYALVGSVGTVATGSGGTASPTFAQATTAGNLLIAWVVGSGTITATQGWTEAVAATSIWCKPNCAANETAPVFSGGALFAALAEFSGGAKTSPQDRSAVDVTGTTPLLLTANGVDAAVGELVIANQSDSLTKAGTVTTSHTYNNGATASGNRNNDATSTVNHYRFSYGITTGNSSADTCSLADNSKSSPTIGGSIVSFKLATKSLAYSDRTLKRNSLLRR